MIALVVGGDKQSVQFPLELYHTNGLVGEPRRRAVRETGVRGRGRRSSQSQQVVGRAEETQRVKCRTLDIYDSFGESRTGGAFSEFCFSLAISYAMCNAICYAMKDSGVDSGAFGGNSP